MIKKINKPSKTFTDNLSKMSQPSFLNDMIERYTEGFKQIKDILSVYLIGSISKREYVSGWSDIDTFIFVKPNSMDKELLSKIRELNNRIAYTFKLGTDTIVRDVNELDQFRPRDLKICIEDGILIYGIDLKDKFKKALGPSLRKWDWNTVADDVFSEYFERTLRAYLDINVVKGSTKTGHVLDFVDEKKALKVLCGNLIENIDVLCRNLLLKRGILTTRKSQLIHYFKGTFYERALDARSRWVEFDPNDYFINEAMCFVFWLKKEFDCLKSKKVSRGRTSARSKWGPPSRSVLELMYMLKGLNKKVEILDIGCGDGRNAIPLAAEKFTVHALDIDKKDILRISNNAKVVGVSNQIKVIAGDFLQMEFKKKYDAVICNYVLHYFSSKDALNVLAKIKNLTKPGGMVLVSAFMKHPKVNAQRHLKYFKRNELKRYFDDWIIIKYLEGPLQSDIGRPSIDPNYRKLHRHFPVRIFAKKPILTDNPLPTPIASRREESPPRVTKR
jgi:2-polyprenyl-3-methyl-5-hydroxy-6-metoxy-1,4-benzoquinol methylase/predicted nucleotidyltransferase